MKHEFYLITYLDPTPLIIDNSSNFLDVEIIYKVLKRLYPDTVYEIYYINHKNQALNLTSKGLLLSDDILNWLN